MRLRPKRMFGEGIADLGAAGIAVRLDAVPKVTVDGMPRSVCVTVIPDVSVREVARTLRRLARQIEAS